MESNAMDQRKPLLLVLARDPDPGEANLASASATVAVLGAGVMGALAGPIGWSIAGGLAKGIGDAVRVTQPQAVHSLAQSSGLETVTFTEAQWDGRMFPPGHPLPGRFYRQHPLARQTAEKAALYIPFEEFDDLLLQEREAELVRLLVDLGACEITIVEGARSKSRAGASLNTVGVDAKVDASWGSSENDARKFVLQGKSWNLISDFDTKAYNWLPFEPAWDALVHARTKGGCVEASVELSRSSSFSLDASMQVSIPISGGGGASAEHGKTEEYLFRVRFPPVVPNAK